MGAAQAWASGVASAAGAASASALGKAALSPLSVGKTRCGESDSTVNGPVTRTRFLSSKGWSNRVSVSALREIEASICQSPSKSFHLSTSNFFQFGGPNQGF